MCNHQEHIIASLAILNVNWDDDHEKDYLHPFSEMLAEVIAQSNENILTIENLQRQYQAMFGLRLPGGVIKSLLKRLEKRKYIFRQNGIYRPNRNRLSRRNFAETRATVLAGYNSLIAKLIDYCETTFGSILSYSDAEHYLESFLAEHQSELLSAIVSRTQPILRLNSSQSPSEKYMTGSFVTEIATNQTVEFNYLERVLKGMMQANVLYLPDDRIIKKRWTTAFYFDTPFLVEALGFQGKTRRDLRLELVNALRATRAKVRCFTHNLQEVRSILHVCLQIFQRGDFGRAHGPMASSIESMIEENYTVSDIILALSTVEERLAEIGIEVVDKPEYVESYVVDESAFEALLIEEYSDNGSADRARQRKNDIDSVASVFRLRKGKSFSRIEECKAVFVTHNVGLLRASHRFFCECEHEITHCLTDFTLSSLLWLSRPDIIPDMPRKQIIADAYAATQPNDALWSRYLGKIDDLKRRGEIRPDDYYAFRYTQEARKSLMEITRGSAEILTDGTVHEILRSVKAKFHEEIVSEADQRIMELQSQFDMQTDELSRQLEVEQSGRLALLEKEIQTSENRWAASKLWAKRVFRLIKYALVFANAVSLWISSPLHIFALKVNDQAHYVQVLVGLAWIVASLIFMLELSDGKSLRIRLDHAELRFARWLNKRQG